MIDNNDLQTAVEVKKVLHNTHGSISAIFNAIEERKMTANNKLKD